MKKNYFTLLLLVFCSISFADRELRELPEGYTWSNSGPGETDFLKPDGWFLKTVSSQGSYGIFITEQDLEKVAEFDVGLSVNVIRNVSEKSGVPALQYAHAFISKLAKTKQLNKEPWVAENGPFTGYGIQTKGDIRNIHYMLISNKATDTLFIIFFEAPPSKWDEAWNIGKNIFSYMKLDGRF